MRQFFRSFAEGVMIGYAFPAIFLIRQMEKDTPDDIKEIWLVIFGSLFWTGFFFILIVLIRVFMEAV